MVASGGRKKDQWTGCGLLPHILGDLQAKDIAVKGDGPVEIAGPQGDVPDTCRRMDCCFVHIALPFLTLVSISCTPFSMCLFLLD